MGTRWRKARRAFCTTIPPDQETATGDNKQQSPSPSPSPRSYSKLGFFSSGSNPTTPRLRCKTPTTSVETPPINESPRLIQCKTTTPKSTKSPKTTPTSPRSPLKLSLFKNSFKFRSSCGICLNSVKTGQGTAIYTAECAHAFHFPCIADRVRKHGSLVCPVCNTTWKDVPLLAIHKNLHTQQPPQNDAVTEKTVIASSSPRFPQPQPKFPDNSRSYDDDEPLLSPTASGGRFNPIPEAENENVEDDEEYDVEEFQGFFVNPKSSSSCNGRDSRNVQVRLLPESAVVSANRGYETYAVSLIVKAPPPPPPPPPPGSRFGNNNNNNTASSHRAPIDLVTVLDVSGSMTGPKLQMLKRAMRLVVSSLGSADRLSIVAFSAHPKRLLNLRRMTAQGQRAARKAVDRLVCGQGSSVGDALKKATKVLEDRRERNSVASIMLLSDGQDERVHANPTHHRHGSSHVSSTRFAHIEIPVHSFGFGQSGGYTHEPAEDAFAKCVGGLLSVVVQDLRIQLNFASGSAPGEISAVYSCNGRPSVLSSGSVRLGDLYAEEERELLVELRVPASSVGSHHVMSVRCLYKDPSSQEVVYGRDQDLLVPRPHAVRSSTAPKIERLRNLFITTRAMAESRRLIEHNDFTSAHHLLASSRALLIQSGSAVGDEYVRVLETELAELHWRRTQMMEQQQQQQQQMQMQMMMIHRRRGSERDIMMDENGEPLTPTSAWRAAEKLAKVAMIKKSLNKVSDLHGFENARF